MNTGECRLTGVTNDLDEIADVEDTADYIELQMDRAENPLSQLSNYEGDIPLIVSNRSERSGGAAHEGNRLEMLVSAASTEEVEMVDLELQIVREDS